MGGSSHVGEIVLIVVLASSGLVISVLKGKLGLAVGGLLLHWCWLVGALRLARPESHWAQWFYDDAKLRRAEQRYGRSDGVPLRGPVSPVSPRS